MKKRLLVVTLFAAIMALALCACGQSGASSSTSADGSASASAASSAVDVAMEALPADAYKTLGDAMSVESDRTMWTYDTDNFIYAFKDNGKWVRVVVDMTDDVYKQLSEMKMPDQAKVKDLVGGLAVTRADMYLDDEPQQADLDSALKGKKGAELATEGYTVDSPSVEDGKTTVRAIKLPFTFAVTFEGEISDPETQDVAGAVKDLPIIDIEYQGLSFDAIRL